jgi:hypothetical protein
MNQFELIEVNELKGFYHSKSNIVMISSSIDDGNTLNANVFFF